MGHTISLPKRLRGKDIKTPFEALSRRLPIAPDTCACKDRRPSLDVDARTCQTAEQEVTSAALLGPAREPGSYVFTPFHGRVYFVTWKGWAARHGRTTRTRLRQLGGKEKRTPSVRSERAAVPDTPSTFNASSPPLTATPANLETTPQPRSRTRTRTHKLACTVHDFQFGGVLHPGTPRLAPNLQAPGSLAKDPDEARGVVTEEDSALAQLEAPDGAA
jgi:hypothetical protein